MPEQQQLNIDLPQLPGVLDMRCDGVECAVYTGNVLRFQFPLSDRTTWRYAAVMLYEAGEAPQVDIAREWGVSTRTVNGWVSGYRERGIVALGDHRGRPVTITDKIKRHIIACREKGIDVNETARRLNISAGSVCEVLYGKRKLIDATLPGLGEQADGRSSCADAVADREESTEPAAEQRDDDELDAGSSAEETGEIQPCASSPRELVDPLDRSADRAFARMGLLQDAEPVFANCPRAEFAGAFLAVALLSRDSFLENVHRVYRGMGAAFYGLRSVFLTLFLMAVLRIKTVEQVNRHSVLKLGRILGLDRSPSVRTLRRKIKQLCLRGQAMNLMNLLGKARFEGGRVPDAVLYIDGHVQCYYGKGRLGKTFSTSRNCVVSGMTDYWVNLGDGTPLLCIPTEYNGSMTKLLPKILRHARKLCGDRQLTVVFDRGGSSAAVYEKIVACGCDFIAYNKNPKPIADEQFELGSVTINGKECTHAPYEREIDLGVYERKANGTYRKTGRTVKVREVIVRREDGGQTAIVTSRRDLSAACTAELIFSRWTQENYLKYAIAEYNLDHLCVYGTEAVSAEIDHPNPEYVELEKTVKSIRRQIATLARVQLDEMTDPELYRPHERFRDLHEGKNGEGLRQLGEALRRTRALMANVPRRISAEDWERIPVESRLLSNVVKMTAYFIEGQLAQIVSAHWGGVNGNERGMVAAFLQSSGSIEASDSMLCITLERQATPQLTRLLKHLCDELTVCASTYPGTNLRMVFEVAC